MSGFTFSSSQFSAYAAAIRQRESTDNYQNVSTKEGDTFYGAYQFGPSALTDAGFLDEQGNWTTLAKSFGVSSYSTFLSTPSAQDAAFQNFTEKNFDYLRDYQSYIGKTIGGVHITESGMLPGAHLVGQGYVKRFLSSNGEIRRHDGNGTPITEYMTKFSHYNFTFPANSSGFSPAINIQPVLAPKHQMAPRKHIDAILKFAGEGKTPTEMLHHTKAQSQLAASKKRASAHMMLHAIRMNPRSQLSSILNAAQKRPPAHMMLHSLRMNPRSQPSSVLHAAPKRPPAAMQLHAALMKSRSQPRSFAPPPSHLAHVRGTQPARIRPHHAPPPTRARTTRASFTPKHEPEGNLLPALSEYLFRLSRLPPNGGTAFDPYLTPTWAGLKLPG